MAPWYRNAFHMCLTFCGGKPPNTLRIFYGALVDTMVIVFLLFQIIIITYHTSNILAGFITCNRILIYLTWIVSVYTCHFFISFGYWCTTANFQFHFMVTEIGILYKNVTPGAWSDMGHNYLISTGIPFAIIINWYWVSYWEDPKYRWYWRSIIECMIYQHKYKSGQF